MVKKSWYQCTDGSYIAMDDGEPHLARNVEKWLEDLKDVERRLKKNKNGKRNSS